jgi:arsenate reductase (thioredoxin)
LIIAGPKRTNQGVRRAIAIITIFVLPRAFDQKLSYMKKTILLGLYVFLAYLSFGQDTLNKKINKSYSTIVFVCEHGAARSTIAAAYFNKLAQEKGLNYRAVFRGNNPDSVIGTATKKGLMQDGFEVAGWKPLPATKQDLENAWQVVTLDCVLPQTHNLSKPVIQWNGIPSISTDYIAARDTILKKIQALVSELSLKK